jgi:hypothetical protein
MPTRLRHLLLSLVAVAAVGLAPPLPGHDGGAVIQAVCPTGTNWDAIIQRCV